MSLQIFWFWKTSNILVFSSSPKKNGFPSLFLKKLNSFLKKKKKKEICLLFQIFLIQKRFFSKKMKLFSRIFPSQKNKTFPFQNNKFFFIKKKKSLSRTFKKKKNLKFSKENYFSKLSMHCYLKLFPGIASLGICVYG